MSLNNIFSRGFNNKSNKSVYTPPCNIDDYEEEEVSELEVLPTPEITLDSQQEAVVYSTEKNIIVIAGAGSGKTRVLTERIRYLVETLHVPAHNIVSITFTNMAAEEMKLRLSDVEGIGDAFIGTIHSFANHIMKESGEKYTLFNDDLDNQLHKELIEKYCTHLTIDRYLEYKDLKALSDTGKVHRAEVDNFFLPSEMAEFNTLHAPAEVVKNDLKEEVHITFGESIETLCKKRGIITFDELLIKAKHYFEKLGASIDYVFVDEFQDVGTLEYNFIRSLSANNYFFVGDDYQSIYGFKGGNVKIFLSLVNSEDFTTYFLTNNYRNGTQILKLATNIINQVDKKVEKNIVPISTFEGEVEVLTRNQLNNVMGKLLHTENDFKDWFFLTRTNKELYDVHDMCINLGIPYTTFKREGMTLADLNKKKASKKLKILTVHTAKGLEIDNVILYGNFPLFLPYYRKNDDERKVMYVGITRAIKRLIILN